jgi:hypothetical protein
MVQIRPSPPPSPRFEPFSGHNHKKRACGAFSVLRATPTHLYFLASAWRRRSFATQRVAIVADRFWI